MPPRQDVTAAPGGDAPPPAAQGGSTMSTLLRIVLFYYFAKNIVGQFGPKAPVAAPGQTPLLTKYSPAKPSGTLVDMWAYFSESGDANDQEAANLVWHETGIALGSIPELSTTITYKPTLGVQSNGSLHLHVFFADSGSAPHPSDEGYNSSAAWHSSWQVNMYLPRPKVVAGVNLLSGKNDKGVERTQAEQSAEADAPREIISFLKPNLTISLVDDATVYERSQIVSQMGAWMSLDDISMSYQPTVFFNDFWVLQSYLVPVNETLQDMPIQLNLNSMGYMKFMMYVQMEQSFSMQTNMGAMAEGDKDEFKRVLLEGNPLFLALTFIVSLLHSVFDMLAFKNDIGFWKNKKTIEGLSVKTIIINVFCQAVIFLYLLDNNTSFVVLASSFVGLLIELWKVTKAMNVSVDLNGGFPYIKFEDRESYTQSKTAEYDAEAMKYLAYVLYPLVIGYGVYSLTYKTHKSWYSWILNSLVGAVYTFGFILMCPQLYLNYKLKSVAHLPWRQMTYKFLNTIVDDLGAFVIKMPTLHRLAVFRDDLVFVFLLYQRWIYPIDKKRANEFGYVAEPSEEDIAARAAEKLADTPAKSAAAEPSSAPVDELSTDSDGFEDLGKDQDTMKLRQRAGPQAVVGASERVAAPVGKNGPVGKKGQ